MSQIETTRLPGKFHSAVERWCDLHLPDRQLLLDNWERFFPRDPCWKLCAYRERNGCPTIEVGDDQGKPKYESVADMPEEQAAQILKAIRAQASTELGSVQQHQLTLSRAQDEQDQFWLLRMMAEEVRHGYQMFSLLLSDEWQGVDGLKGEDVVEEILSMRTGNHVLPAFNVDFDSFVDNIVFCALIDRVGKYQLSMQKISAYRPMGQSMPPMLREEAFHLAAGVVPLRRWVMKAAKGGDDCYVTMPVIQRTINKWYPRGLDMFGDERGGGSNIRYGFKPMKNDESQAQYRDEVAKLVGDLNLRFVRTRVKSLSNDEAVALRDRVLAEGKAEQGVAPEDLLTLPDKSFLRRVGVYAYAMNGIDGKPIEDSDAFKGHLIRHLPEAYATDRDFRGYLELVRKVKSGEMTVKAAIGSHPNLRRVGGVCPCSKAVRWV